MPQQGPRPSAYYVERMALTRSPAAPDQPTDKSSNYNLGQNAPGEGSTRAGDGLVLSGLMSIVVSIWPNTGTTFSGAGTMLCWVYNPFMGLWGRCEELDIDLSTSASMPGVVRASFQNVSRLGMLINWLSSGVTVGAGTDILLRLDGFTSVGSQAI